MNESSSQPHFVAPEPSDLAPLFPAYEIHHLIAAGGMGAVYQAMQKSLDRTVALKILPMEFSKDVEFCAGFEAEAKAMARLNHPNLIGVHDFGEVNGMLFIVMEFVPGKSIYHSAHGQAIEPSEVIRLVTGVCNGLAHAHENGILHRDIKPSNILLTPQAEPKIGDFGLARPVEREIQEGEVVYGTPGYTAPEVVNAPETVDHRADLFSVGVLLHELLTGKLPGDDPRPASLIAGCNARFDAIIRRATDPLPGNRYSSATEISAALRQITSVPKAAPTAPILAAGPGARTSGPPKPRRKPIGAIKRKSSKLSWVGPLLAIGIMGYCWYYFLNMKPRMVVVVDPAAKPAAASNSTQDPELTESPPAEEKQEDSQPATELLPTEQVQIAEIDATDLMALRSKIGETIRVRGTVVGIAVTPRASVDCYVYFSKKIEDSCSIRVPVPGDSTQLRYQRLTELKGKSLHFEGVLVKSGEEFQVRIPSLEGLTFDDSQSQNAVDVNVVSHRQKDSEELSEPDVKNDKRQAGVDRKPPAGIPSDATYFNETWYRVYQEFLTWSMASEKCRLLGGQLAVIPNQETQNFIVKLLNGEESWLGASDLIEEDKWLWSDGTSMTYRNFAKHQPDNAGNVEHYLTIWRDGRWNDIRNQGFRGNIARYICEWPDRPVVAIIAREDSDKQNPQGIPSDAKHFNGKWYRVYDEPKSWNEARDRCRAIGGQLVVIPNQNTQNFVKELAGNRLLWLGATDEKREGEWLWIDGSGMRYNNFHPVEPNNVARVEHYLVINFRNIEGYWCDFPDKADVNGFICEWPDKPVTRTSIPAVEAIQPLPGPVDSIATAREKAFKDFPQLNDSDSRLSRAMAELKAKQEFTNSAFFKKPDWPYTLASMAQSSLRESARQRKQYQRFPDGAKTFNGKKYLVYLDNVTWNHARIRCNDGRGQLAVIPDEATQGFIRDLAQGRSLWLGATDERKDGTWIWVDGTRMNYQAFDALRRQPNNSQDEDFLACLTGGLWHDFPVKDDGMQGYICEWYDTPNGGRTRQAKEAAPPEYTPMCRLLDNTENQLDRKQRGQLGWPIHGSYVPLFGEITLRAFNGGLLFASKDGKSEMILLKDNTPSQAPYGFIAGDYQKHQRVKTLGYPLEGEFSLFGGRYQLHVFDKGITVWRRSDGRMESAVFMWPFH